MLRWESCSPLWYKDLATVVTYRRSQFSLIRERGASENLEAVKETMRKKNHVKKNVNPNKGSTKTFICFSS